MIRKIYFKVLINKGIKLEQWDSIDIPLETNETFVKLSIGYLFCALLTSNNNVILWGENDCGQIGNGEISKTPLTEPYKLIFRPLMKAIEAPPKVAWYKCHHEAKKETKEEMVDPYVSSKVKYEGEGISNVIDVVCGQACTFALMDNGNVYGWGHARCMGIECVGQVRENMVLKQDCVLRPFLMLGSTKQIEACNNYFMALRSDGVLFTTGCLEKDTPFDIYSPPERHPIRFKRVGVWHQLAMGETRQGKFFVWGDYRKPVKIGMVNIVEKIPIGKKVNKSVQCNIKVNQDGQQNDQAGLRAIQYYNDNFPNYYNDSKTRIDDEQDDDDFDKIEKEIKEEEEKEYKEKSEKEQAEKERIKLKALEAVKKGQANYYHLPLSLSKPCEVSAGSFEDIVAVNFNKTYHTYNHDHQVIKSEQTKELTTYQAETKFEKGELIEFSDLIFPNVNYEFDTYELIREIFRVYNDQEKEMLRRQIKDKDGQLRTVSKDKERDINVMVNTVMANQQKTHHGDHVEASLFRECDMRDAEGVKLNNVNLTGKASV